MRVYSSLLDRLSDRLNFERFFAPYTVLEFFDLLTTYDLTAMIYEYNREGYPHYVDTGSSQVLTGYEAGLWKVCAYLITPADELLDATMYLQSGKIVLSSYEYIYDVQDRRKEKPLIDRLLNYNLAQRKEAELKAKHILSLRVFHPRSY